MTPPTSTAKNAVSHKRPRMRLLSVGVNPSFFFVATRYSITMSAMPAAMTIPTHLVTVLTAGLPEGPKSASLPDFLGEKRAHCVAAECKEECLPRDRRNDEARKHSRRRRACIHWRRPGRRSDLLRHQRSANDRAGRAVHVRGLRQLPARGSLALLALL